MEETKQIDPAVADVKYGYAQPIPVAGGGPWTAVRATPLVSALIVLVLLGAGLAVGVARKPRYTATSRLAVLRLNFGAAGALAGFSTAAASLADAYARSIQANGIVQPLAAQFHQSVKTVNTELSSAAVPQSAVFLVSATTRSARTSVALSAAAANGLVNYFHSVNGSSTSGNALYSQLKSAQSSLSSDLVKKQAVLAGINLQMRLAHQTLMSKSEQSALAKADAAAATDQAQVNALQTAYQQQLSNSSSTQFVQLLSTATAAQSDRKSKLALFAFIGLVLGVGLAVGVALGRQARRLARHRVT